MIFDMKDLPFGILSTPLYLIDIFVYFRPSTATSPLMLQIMPFHFDLCSWESTKPHLQRTVPETNLLVKIILEFLKTFVSFVWITHFDSNEVYNEEPPYIKFIDYIRLFIANTGLSPLTCIIKIEKIPTYLVSA